MQGDMIHHLVRRGVDIVSSQADLRAPVSAGDDHDSPVEIPRFAVLAIGMTMTIALLMMTSIRYTLWGVVANLAMIEQPQNTYLVREEKTSNKADDPNAEDTIDSEVILIKNKPITSNIRATMKHLTSRAGFRARWRGLSAFIVYSATHSLITNWISGFIFKGTTQGIMTFSSRNVSILEEFAGPKMLGSMIATAITARLAMTWCHIVISEPSQKTWWSRIPERKTWKHVVIPAVVADVATRLSLFLPGLCFMLLARADAGNTAIATSQILTCFAIFLVTFVGLAIPASITLARVQASMLPYEYDTIVPFDRSFAGRVVPRILGGSGAISFKDAWKTFDYAGRMRVVKMFIKFFVIDIALHVFFTLVLLAEAFILIGPETIRKLLEQNNMIPSGMNTMDARS